jgi:hypothetical protein
MSNAPAADPYATAKANLRDTIKWLATSLAAVGAAVIAGASINGLAALEGKALIYAALLGGAGLVLILIAIAVMVSLLTSDVFYFSQLTAAGDPVGARIAGEINAHATDILSPQTDTIDALVRYRNNAVANMRGAQPGDAAYQTAFKQWTAANDLVARVTNLAQFMALRDAFKNKTLLLFALTIGVILSLGGYALLAGGKSSLNAELAQKAVFQPGNGWSSAAASLAKECGADPLNGTLVSKKPFEGWVTIRLADPGKCSGLELSVPASLVQLSGPER